MTPARIALACLLPIVAAACQDNNPKAAEGAKAGGAILERSITDDMIPYDTIRSQAPLAEPSGSASDTPSSGTSGSDASDRSGDGAVMRDAE